MRDTLISAAGRAPQRATHDTDRVVEGYRRRQAARRSLLAAVPLAPGASGAAGAPRHRAAAC